MDKSRAILYVPSDTPEAMMMATDKVAGVPIIVRGIMTLMQAGISRCTLLIAEAQREKIQHFLSRYEDQRLPEIEIISYAEPYRVSPETVAEASAAMAERCILIDANLLFEKELIAAITSVKPAPGDFVLCKDGELPIPAMEIPRDAWDELGSFTAQQPRSIESCLKKLFEGKPPRIAQKPASSNTFLVRRRRDRAVAEKFLTEAIRHSTGGPVAKYINKRISLPISVVLSKLWVSPNAITAFNIVIGVFSGVFAADGHRYDVILLGAALFQIASIVDGCDGEVAKLTFRASKFGQYIDSLSDNLSLGSFMTGLIAGYWRSTHSHVAFSVGAVMIISTAIILGWMILYLKRHTQSASFVTFDKEYLQKLSDQPRWFLTFVHYGKYMLKKDVFSFAFLLFAVAGHLYWWLFIAAFGTAVGAITLTYLNIRDSAAARRAAKSRGGRPAVAANAEGRTI